MRRVCVLLLAVFLGFSCTSRKEDAGTAGEKEAWPKGLQVGFDPQSRTVLPDGKVRMWVDNKTGEDFKYEWVLGASGTGQCGDLQYRRDAAHEAVFIGGRFPADCNCKVALKVTGKGGPYEKQYGLRVRGSKEFAELEVRPDPLPESWLLVNDFEKTLEGREVKCITVEGGKEAHTPSVGLAVDSAKKRKKTDDQEAAEAKAKSEGKAVEIVDYYDNVQLNLLEAPFGPWAFEFATCRFVVVPEGEKGQEKGVLALLYDIPHHDDYCGYFETLSIGRDCESTPHDLSGFDRVTFIGKSGDGQKHRIYVEIVAWEKFSEFHQGRTEPVGPLTLDEKWHRFEIPLVQLYKDTLDAKSIKSVSFKFQREADFPDHGIVLLDNVALIRKGEVRNDDQE